MAKAKKVKLSEKKNQTKNKAKFLDKYIVWNLLYSVFTLIFIVFMIFFGALYNHNLPSGRQFGGNWFYLVIGVTCTWAMFLFIPNIVYTSIMLWYYSKHRNIKYLILFSFGLLIPFVTIPYYVDRTKMLKQKNSQKKEELFVIKPSKTKRAMISKYVSFSLLGAIGVLLTPIFGSIVAAGLTEYYPDSVLKLDVKNRPDGEEEKMEIGKSYTACSYNIGYGALNQGTYTFADTGSVSSYIYGKARASSKAEVNFSVNGLENIINDGHDTNGVFWPNQLENKTFKSNELTKEYMKQEGENTYRAEPDNQLSDRPIEDFHGSVVYKTSYDSDSKKPTKDEQLTADEAINEENLPGKFDLVGLQEIDRNSTRSYDVDMYDQITNDLGSFNSSYAVNYSVPWCPIPLLPLNMGQIESGVAALSKFQINDATRYSLDSINTPIYRYMTLKRCILENRIPLYKADGEETGKYLIFIVTHLDAYDNGGAVRSAQLKLLDDIMYEEYNSGNYVIACADWNCTLPDTHGYEGDINDLEDDQPIASFDYREDDPSKISYTNPKNDQFYEWKGYDSKTTYNKGDVVTYNAADEDWKIEQDNNLNNLHKYKNNWKQNQYQAIHDDVTSAPVIDGKLNLKDWTYYTSDIPEYQNCALNKATLEDKMPHMFKGSENAHFYTTHAIPTLRKCGANMRIKESYNSYSYNFKKTVDGFLCTNNVQIECSYGFDNAFLYSDHQPVAIRFVLN